VLQVVEQWCSRTGYQGALAPAAQLAHLGALQVQHVVGVGGGGGRQTRSSSGSDRRASMGRKSCTESSERSGRQSRSEHRACRWLGTGRGAGEGAVGMTGSRGSVGVIDGHAGQQWTRVTQARFEARRAGRCWWNHNAHMAHGPMHGRAACTAAVLAVACAGEDVKMSQRPRARRARQALLVVVLAHQCRALLLEPCVIHTHVGRSAGRFGGTVEQTSELA
jgi:hypothetical protein